MMVGTKVTQSTDPELFWAQPAAELRSAWTAEGRCPYAGLDGRGRPSLHQRHFARRLYFFSTSRRRSWGRAMTVWLSMPVMVSAATMALTTASSVAWTVARNRGSRLSLGNILRSRTPLGDAAPGFAVEKATKMSPESLPE